MQCGKERRELEMSDVTAKLYVRTYKMKPVCSQSLHNGRPTFIQADVQWTCIEQSYSLAGTTEPNPQQNIVAWSLQCEICSGHLQTRGHLTLMHLLHPQSQQRFSVCWRHQGSLSATHHTKLWKRRMVQSALLTAMMYQVVYTVPYTYA